MTRFGYAIRIGGDPQIGEALADGIGRGTDAALRARGAGAASGAPTVGIPDGPEEPERTEEAWAAQLPALLPAIPDGPEEPERPEEAWEPDEVTIRAQEAVRNVAMRRHTPEEWATMTTEARYLYGQDPDPLPGVSALMAVWVMLVCIIWAMIDGQEALLGGDGRD